MGFGIDYTNVQQGGIIAAGTYEMIIKEANVKTTKTGTEYINIPMVVRNDIEQAYQNMYVWHTIWKKKEPTAVDAACDGFSSAYINALSKGVAVPDKRQYKNLAEWMEDLKGKVVRATIKHKTNGNNEPRAEVEKFEVTDKKLCKHIWKEKSEPTSNKPSAGNNIDANFYPVGEISEDEFPF